MPYPRRLLHVLVALTMGAAWTTDWVNGDHFLGGGVASAPAAAGHPDITVSMASCPVGLPLVTAALDGAQIGGTDFGTSPSLEQRFL